MEHTLCQIGTVAMVALVLYAAHFAAAAPAEPMHAMPMPCEETAKALASEKLKELAAATNDPDVLLRLMYLTQTNDPAGEEIAKLVVKAKPDYAAVMAVLRVTIARPEEANVAELIARDPDNALGHYLRATLL